MCHWENKNNIGNEKLACFLATETQHSAARKVALFVVDYQSLVSFYNGTAVELRERERKLKKKKKKRMEQKMRGINKISNKCWNRSHKKK